MEVAAERRSTASTCGKKAGKLTRTQRTGEIHPSFVIPEMVALSVRRDAQQTHEVRLNGRPKIGASERVWEFTPNKLQADGYPLALLAGRKGGATQQPTVFRPISRHYSVTLPLSTAIL